MIRQISSRINFGYPSWYLTMMGVSYIGTENYEKAIPLFTKAINTAPTAGNHALYCHTLSMIGKHEEALGIRIAIILIKKCRLLL